MTAGGGRPAARWRGLKSGQVRGGAPAIPAAEIITPPPEPAPRNFAAMAMLGLAGLAAGPGQGGDGRAVRPDSPRCEARIQQLAELGLQERIQVDRGHHRSARKVRDRDPVGRGEHRLRMSIVDLCFAVLSG
jgi:hypothetical protein